MTDITVALKVAELERLVTAISSRGHIQGLLVGDSDRDNIGWAKVVPEEDSIRFIVEAPFIWNQQRWNTGDRFTLPRHVVMEDLADFWENVRDGS